MDKNEMEQSIPECAAIEGSDRMSSGQAMEQKSREGIKQDNAKKHISDVNISHESAQPDYSTDYNPLKSYWEATNSPEGRLSTAKVKQVIGNVVKEPDTKQGTKTTKDPEYLYRIHSSGHSVVISRYSNRGTGVRSALATKARLTQIIAIDRETVFIDIDNLSMVQQSGVFQTLRSISEDIKFARVDNLLIVKYDG